MSKNISIIGGGLVGTSIADMLLKHKVERPDAPEISISIFDPKEKLGQGIPYARTAENDFLNDIATNNQPNNRMSYDPSDPDAFSRFLNPEAPSDLNNEFSSRTKIGEYANKKIERRIAQSGGQLRHIRSKVTSISGDSGQTHVVKTDKDEHFHSDIVIIADGHQYSHAMPELEGHSQFFGRYEDLDRAKDVLEHDPDGSVIIRGTSQSMVDWLRLIDAVGFHGDIYAVSRRGYMPWEFRPEDHPVENDSRSFELTRMTKLLGNHNYTAEDLVSTLNQEISEAAEKGIGRALVYSKAINTISAQAQNTKNPELKSFFNFLTAMYGNPTPPASYNLIKDLRQQGRLKIIQGSCGPENLQKTKTGFKVQNVSGLDDLNIQAVFDAAIYSRDAISANGKVHSPLLQQLHADKKIIVDEESARVFSAGVQKTAGLYMANGPATNYYKWGIEGFREKNDQIAQEIITTLCNFE